MDRIPTYISALKKSGSLWVSWPKKSSRIRTDLLRDPIREYLLSLGLVDVKVAAAEILEVIMTGLLIRQ